MPNTNIGPSTDPDFAQSTADFGHFRVDFGQLWADSDCFRDEYGRFLPELASIGPDSANSHRGRMDLGRIRRDLADFDRTWQLSTRFGPSSTECWRFRPDLGRTCTDSGQFRPNSHRKWPIATKFGPILSRFASNDACTGGILVNHCVPHPPPAGDSGCFQTSSL